MDNRKLSDVVNSIDKRLAVIEERTEGLSKLKERVAVNSAIVALFVSLVTAYLVHSITPPANEKTSTSPTYSVPYSERR